MSQLVEIVFWFSVALVVYGTVGYPMLLALAASIRRRTPRCLQQRPVRFSIVLAVHNEVLRIRDRLQELRQRAEETGLDWDIIVASDGSTDGTAEAARAAADESVRVIELPRCGKASSLNAACGVARGEILVFVDARQSLEPGALEMMLDRFTDPSVGAVSGELILESAPGVLAGVGWYWSFEKWLRRKEGELHSVVGATGAISAVRRELYRPIPHGTLLDDVYWPLSVVMGGRRVVHEPRARAFDRLSDQASHEFRRKVRTLAGNYQLMLRLPSALLPWRNPVWVQYVSHKVVRLFLPWALAAIFLSSCLLEHPIYRSLFYGQIAFYALALIGLSARRTRRVWLPANAAASFVLLNAAAWMAFWVWITGNSSRVWDAPASSQREWTYRSRDAYRGGRTTGQRANA